MDRLIDVDKLITEMQNYLKEPVKHKMKIGEKAIERKHGHWIKTDWGDYKCSECGHYEETTYAGKNKIYKDFSDFLSCNNFCRDCGSFMEEVSEDENI